MIPSRETLVEAERRTQFRAPQLEIVIRLRDLLFRLDKRIERGQFAIAPY